MKGTMNAGFGLVLGLIGLLSAGSMGAVVAPVWAAPAVSESSADQEAVMFVASREAKKYHLPTCAFAKRISERTQVEFESAKEAQKAGYTACKVCLKDGKAAQTSRATRSSDSGS